MIFIELQPSRPNGERLLFEVLICFIGGGQNTVCQLILQNLIYNTFVRF